MNENQNPDATSFLGREGDGRSAPHPRIGSPKGRMNGRVIERAVRAGALLVASAVAAAVITTGGFYFYVGRNYVFGGDTLYPDFALAQPGYYVQMSLSGWLFVGLPIAIVVFASSWRAESGPRAARMWATLMPVGISFLPGWFIWGFYGTRLDAALVALASTAVAVAIYGLALLLVGYYRRGIEQPSPGTGEGQR